LLLTSFLIARTALAQPIATDTTFAKIDTGAVRGVVVEGTISFKGIPYAAPSVGELRWRVPQPVKPWQDVLSADKFGPACMQADNVPKSEDCLTLNVWRPAAASASPLPVIVWIHGARWCTAALPSILSTPWPLRAWCW
jgi:para-nitrobenzyl esterase